jgi:hypothetical protein
MSDSTTPAADPHPDDLHSDQYVTASALPADERAFMDRHFGYDRPFDDFDVDAAFVAEMERRDAASIITAGNVAIMDSLAVHAGKGCDVTALQTMVLLSCGTCGIQFCVPDEYLRCHARDGEDISCPNGHTSLLRQRRSQRNPTPARPRAAASNAKPLSFAAS